MTKGYFDVTQPGLTQGNRDTRFLANDKNENGRADIIRIGEWLVEVDGKLTRPGLSGAVGGLPDIDALTLHSVWPVIAAEGRTDVSSGFRATLLQDIGAVCRTNGVLGSYYDEFVGTPSVPLADGEGTQGDLVTTADIWESATGNFIANGVQAGDTLTVVGGLNDGSYEILEVVNATTLRLSGIGDDVDGYGKQAQHALAGNDGGSQDFYVTGYRTPDFGANREASLALYQAEDGSLICGLIPNGAGLPTFAADGVTPGKLVDDGGPVVATALKPVYAQSGVGRNGSQLVIDILLK